VTIPDLATLPDHVRALQDLVNRCPALEGKKHFIVAAGCAEAITGDEAHLLITANHLETV
jgi:hypothetical protein